MRPRPHEPTHGAGHRGAHGGVSAVVVRDLCLVGLLPPGLQDVDISIMLRMVVYAESPNAMCSMCFASSGISVLKYLIHVKNSMIIRQYISIIILTYTVCDSSRFCLANHLHRLQGLTLRGSRALCLSFALALETPAAHPGTPKVHKSAAACSVQWILLMNAQEHHCS